MTIAPSDMNRNGLAGAAACAAGAAASWAACADPPSSAPITITPTAIERMLPGRPTTVGLTSDRNITASLNKRTDTLAQSRAQELYESRHYLMSKKHSLTRQPQSSAVALQQAGAEEGFELGSIPRPDVYAIG